MVQSNSFLLLQRIQMILLSLVLALFWVSIRMV
jgi:hypothetical protein